MSIFDKEDLITEEFLISKGFQRDINISSPYSEYPERFVLQVHGLYGWLMANIFYYLDETNDSDSPRYQFYVGFRVYSPLGGETWSSREFNGVRDRMDFDICLEKAYEIIKGGLNGCI